jgi:phosphoglycolate phosphatase-like HAD superfamily hydrolase
MRPLIFDLDGTLIDTIYAHVFAWQRALAEVGDPDRRLAHPSGHDVTHAPVKSRTGQLANPFRPGNGVTPPHLAGHDALLDDYESFTAEAPLHPNWALTGLRGTGKTVLLGELAARAGAPRLSRDRCPRSGDQSQAALQPRPVQGRPNHRRMARARAASARRGP